MTVPDPDLVWPRIRRLVELTCRAYPPGSDIPSDPWEVAGVALDRLPADERAELMDLLIELRDLGVFQRTG